MPSHQKSELRTRQQDRARQQRQDAKARRSCTDAVWARDGVVNGKDTWAECHYCGVPVARVGGWWWTGHVHEELARSLGGDPHNPAGAVIACHGCHFPGPSGAHRRSVRASQ